MAGTSAPDIVASLVHTICSHTSDVNGVCFSKDKKLASCSADKTVRVWNTDDYSELQCSPLCGHTYYVHCCTFSPFGTLLASCSTDGKVIIWDLNTGQKKAVLEHESKSPIRVVRFSPDSSKLVSGGDDNNLCLWDLNTKSLLITYRGHEGTVFAVDFTPDGQYIVSGSSDGDLMVWDATVGHGKALYLDLEGHDLGVMCCEFSPAYDIKSASGSSRFLLATCGTDDLLKTWHFSSEHSKSMLTMQHTFKGHTGSVLQCRFSINGKLLASGSSDKTVRLWDPLKGTSLHVIEGHKRYVICVAFSSDGQFLASGSNDKTVMVYKLQSEQQLFTALENGEAVADCVPGHTSRLAMLKQPDKWSVDEVCQWLTGQGLEQYSQVFRQQDIDGAELLTLDHDTLQSALHIASLGHRNKILRSRDQIQDQTVILQKQPSSDSGIPDEYLCPITRELMKDPVICSDGYTYERTAITSWMSKGKDRSPMTNAVLNNKDMTPNRSLKMLIQRYHKP